MLFGKQFQWKCACKIGTSQIKKEHMKKVNWASKITKEYFKTQKPKIKTQAGIALIFQ